MILPGSRTSSTASRTGPRPNNRAMRTTVPRRPWAGPHLRARTRYSPNEIAATTPNAMPTTDPPTGENPASSAVPTSDRMSEATTLGRIRSPSRGTAKNVARTAYSDETNAAIVGPLRAVAILAATMKIRPPTPATNPSRAQLAKLRSGRLGLGRIPTAASTSTRTRAIVHDTAAVPIGVNARRAIAVTGNARPKMMAAPAASRIPTCSRLSCRTWEAYVDPPDQSGRTLSGSGRTIGRMEAIPPEALLAEFPAVTQDTAHALRAIVREAVPDSWERVRVGWHLIGYDLPLRRYGVYFAYVAPEAAHVHLGFEWGALMDDPARLLQGEGLTKQVRWLTFTSPDEILREPTLALVREGARVAAMTRDQRVARALDLI